MSPAASGDEARGSRTLTMAGGVFKDCGRRKMMCLPLAELGELVAQGEGVGAVLRNAQAFLRGDRVKEKKLDLPDHVGEWSARDSNQTF